MKKWMVALAAGVVAGIGIYRGTKRKQEKARENGRHIPFGPYEAYIKRPVDVILSVLALIILSPVLAVTAVLVRFKLGTPILFTQERPGLDEHIFKLYKFRTMLNPKDGVIDPSDDANRLTPFGEKLRSTSLDARVIIGQTTETIENKGFREVSPISFLGSCSSYSRYGDRGEFGDIVMLSA